MIQFFRKFFQSKLGIGVTLGFLALIALAFASSDVANTGMFGGVAGGDRVANVGDVTHSSSDLINNANTALQQARQNNPTLTMEAFIAQGGLDDVLEQMISRTAIAEFSRGLGLRAGSRLIDSEIVGIPAFQGLDGEFSAETFRAALRQQGLSESAVRVDLADGLFARQLMLPISYSANLPSSFALRYAQLSGETRVGSVATISAAAFAPTRAPSPEELQSYYRANRGQYVRPERRVIRFAMFDQSALGDLPPISQQAVASRFQRDAANYAASETRSFTRLVLPTQAAAQAVIDEVNGGLSLEASARAKGLQTAVIADVDRAALQSQSSQAVANAGFAAGSGELAAPARGSLGWFVLRVDEVTRTGARTLAQASPEIRQQLEGEARQDALDALTERLEDEFQDGRSLSEAARELGVQLTTTAPLTATGQVYGTQTMAPDAIAPAVGFAFQLSEDSPELAELVPGQQYMIFDVSEITPSASAPLAEISDQVVVAWRREQGLAAAGAAAERILERVEGGATLAAAVAGEQVNLPAPQNLRLNRQQASQQPIRPNILLFTMATGSTKRVEADELGAWFVVALSAIEIPDIAADDPRVLGVQQQLAASVGQEYFEQFVTAMRETLEVESNDVAIDAVRAQLLGTGN